MHFEYKTFQATITASGTTILLSPLGNKRYIVERLFISVNKKIHLLSILVVQDSVNSKVFLKLKGDSGLNRPFILKNLLIARNGNLAISTTINNDEIFTVYGHARIQG